MASRRKRPRSPSNAANEDTTHLCFQSPIDILRAIPIEINCERVTPYAVRIIETRDEFRSALDYHISIVDTPGRSFPVGYCPIAEWDVSRVTNVIETRKELIEDVNRHVWIANTEGESFPIGYTPIGEWDVSRVRNFSSVFFRARNPLMRHFNEDIGDWDVSNGTNFSAMFNGCRQFRADLSRWNVSNGIYFTYMFSGCTHFNSDVSQWNVANGTLLRGMFRNCPAFDRESLSQWNIDDPDRLFLEF